MLIIMPCDSVLQLRVLIEGPYCHGNMSDCYGNHAQKALVHEQ